MNRKLLIFILLALSGVGTALRAQTIVQGAPENGVIINYYVYDDGHAEVSGFSDLNNPKTGIVNVQDAVEYNGTTYPVTGIGSGGFQANGYNEVTSISLPATVQSIQQNAFSGCTKLHTVTFRGNSQLSSIGYRAFYNCDSLKSITIPASVDTLHVRAFEDCDNLDTVYFNAVHCEFTGEHYTAGSWYYTPFKHVSLSSIVIGNTVQKLPNHFLMNTNTCPTLQFASNSTLEDLGSYAFSSTGYTSITLPASVKTIGFRAFEGCEQLASVTFDGTPIVETIGNGAFKGCSSLHSFSIPSTVKTIKRYAFDNCGLYSVTLPASLEYIDPEIFIGCTSLQTVAFADGIELEYLSENCFAGCSALTFIEIPSSVKMIEPYAFSGCENLTTVTFEENTQLESIERMAFQFCNKLRNIHVPAGVNIGEFAFLEVENIYVGAAHAADLNCPWGARFCNATFDGDFVYADQAQTQLIGYLNTKATAVTVPSTVVSIGDEVFAGMRNLTSVAFPTGITSLGNAIFYGCPNLGEVVVNNTLLHAATLAEGDTTYTIPNSITAISAGAFYDRTITAFALEAGNTLYTVQNGVLYNADKSVLVAYPINKGAASFVTPSSVTALAPGAFFRLGSVKLTLSPNLQAIGDYAFFQTGGNLTIPKQVAQIGNKAFYNSSMYLVMAPTTPPAVHKNAFSTVERSYFFYLYPETYYTYRDDTYWGRFINCVYPKKSAEQKHQSGYWADSHNDTSSESGEASVEKGGGGGDCNYAIIIEDGRPYDYYDIPYAPKYVYHRTFTDAELGKWQPLVVPFKFYFHTANYNNAESVAFDGARFNSDATAGVELTWRSMGQYGSYNPGQLALFKPTEKELFIEALYGLYSPSSSLLEELPVVSNSTNTRKAFFRRHFDTLTYSEGDKWYAYKNGNLVQAGGSLQYVVPFRFSLKIKQINAMSGGGKDANDDTWEDIDSVHISNVLLTLNGNDTTATPMDIDFISLFCGTDGLKYERLSDTTLSVAGRCSMDESNTTISIPSAVDGLDVTAISYFNNASNVTSIALPASITAVEPGAFAGCTSLTSFSVNSANTTFAANSDGMLTTADGSGLVAYPAGQSTIFTYNTYTLPTSFSSIASKAFAGSDIQQIVAAAPTAPSLEEEAFGTLDVTVPVNLMGAYFSNPDWLTLNPTVLVTDGSAYDGTYSRNLNFKVRYTRNFSRLNDGNWQAVFVPFSAKYSETDWHKYGSMAKLAGVKDLGNAYQLNWEYLQRDEMVEAGMPYIFLPNSTAMGAEKMEFAAHAIASAADTHNVSVKDVAADTVVTFTLQGTYQTKQYASGDIWYALHSGNFMQAGSGATLNPYRIFFTVKDATNQTIACPKGITNTLDGNEVGIEIINFEAPERPLDNNYYDILGRRIERPVPGRVYIHQGKKIIFER